VLSNQLLTGQEVMGRLCPTDAGNNLQVAVNRLLKGVRPKQVQGIFASQNAMTASPLVKHQPRRAGGHADTNLERVVGTECTWKCETDGRKVKAAPQSQICTTL